MKIKVDDKEYETDDLSDAAKTALSLIQFADIRINEIKAMQTVFVRSNNCFVKSLTQEIISGKAGFLINDD